MQIILDFINSFYQNGNASFRFREKNKICEFCISLNQDKELTIIENVYKEQGGIDYSITSSLPSLLTYLIVFSVIKKSIFKQKEFSMTFNPNLGTPKQELWGINIIYQYIEAILDKAILDKEQLIMACCGSEEKFFKYLYHQLPDNFHITLSEVLDKNFLEIIFRKHWQNYIKNILEGLQLYYDLQNSDSVDYDIHLRSWHQYLGKVKENRNSVLNTKIPYTYLDEELYLVNPAVGRDEELKQLCISLLTLTKSPLLVGASGVGKTAVVEGLAYLLQKGSLPNNLKNKKIMRVAIPSLVSGCQYVGSFEKKMEELIFYLKNNPDIVLFLDEMHTAIGAGSSSKSDLDLANILKPYLDRGQIKIIGSTTKEEFEKFITQDLAFKRRFERININEPDESMLKQIISSYIIKLSTLTNIVYPFERDINEQITSILIEATKNKNRVYDDKRNNPDLVLSILEKAFAYAQYRNESSLSLDDLSIALSTCEVLYEDNRKRFAKKILLLSSNSNRARAKIILFPGN